MPAFYFVKVSPMTVPGIFLVGMMGAGKSTVGKRLAARLGLRFIDLDRELEARCGASIPTIFELEGEAGFRRRESALVEEITQESGTVLGTGGGVVTVEANRSVLHERGFVVYLRASAPDLWTRLKRDQGRPMLRAANARGRMEHLLEQRIPLYESIAHLTVDTGKRPVTDVLAAIESKLPEVYQVRGDDVAAD
jgi:shikimate kinase